MIQKFFSRKLDLLAIALLALMCAGFYWRILFGGAWMPSGGGDLVSFLWPTYTFAARSLRAGVIPLWNPYLYSGMPFAADNQSGLFYPFNLLVFFLVPNLTYFVMELMSVMHVWWAGAGMYVLLRTMKARRVPAFAGALAWMFSDAFVIHFGNYNLIAVAAWLPLIFAAFRLALDSDENLPEKNAPNLSGRATRRFAQDLTGFRYALISGALWGVAALAGHIQVTLFIGLWLGGYALFKFSQPLPPGRKDTKNTKNSLFVQSRKFGVWVSGWLKQHGSEQSPSRFRILAFLALTVLIAFAFAALMFIPAYEMTRYTGRVGLDYAEAARYSLPPAGLLGLFVPGLWGRGAGSWAPWLRVEVGYAGVLTLALAVLGAAVRRRGEVRGERTFLVAAVAIAFLLALGGYSALHGWLYRFVPGFGGLRAPARIVLLADFGLALLAGLGLDALMSPLARYARVLLRSLSRIVAWLAVALAAIGLPLCYFLISRSAYDAGLAHRYELVMNSVVFGVILLAASALVLAARHGHWTTPARLGVIAVVVLATDLVVLGSSVDVEKNDPAIGYAFPSVVEFLRRDPDPFRLDSVPAPAWQADGGALHGLADIGGIHNPLGLAAYNTFVGGMGARGSALYNFLNVKYVLAEKGQPPGDARFVPVFNADPRIDVYLNTAALPRAMLVGESVPVASGEQAWEAIHRPDFDPARRVVIENGPQVSSASGRGTLSIQSLGINDIELKAETDAPVYLVLSEVYYPGWRAEVNGRETRIYPANFAFRAVYLEPGTHRVRLFFSPASWWVGLTISAVAWGALLLVSVFSRRSFLREHKTS